MLEIVRCCWACSCGDVRCWYKYSGNELDASTGRKAEGKQKSSEEAWKSWIPGGYEHWLSLLPLLEPKYGNGKGEH